MAYTTINKSSSFMNNKIYTGNGAASHAITGIGFKPDWTWIKSRSNTTDHILTDIVRGVTIDLKSNTNAGNATDSNHLKSFDSDGFTLGTENDVNGSSRTYASWNWKAGTAVSGNTGGSGSYKTYSGSVDTTAGFSIIKYTGNGSAGHTIPHHLGAVPKMIIFKQLTGSNVDWRVYHESLGNTHRLCLNDTSASNNDDSAFNDTSPTSSVFTVGGSSSTNPNNYDVIAYCFADKTGYSKFGSYVGNGNADGSFVYTGFKPAFVMAKKSSDTGGWQLRDNKRTPTGNLTNNLMYANATSTEQTTDGVDFLSNGWKLRNSAGDSNASGATYIYMAFGQSLVGSNNIPATAR